MRLLIRDNETIKTIDTEEDWTLNDLKEKIEDITFLPANLIYLTSNSRILQIGKLDNQIEVQFIAVTAKTSRIFFLILTRKLHQQILKHLHPFCISLLLRKKKYKSIVLWE